MMQQKKDIVARQLREGLEALERGQRTVVPSGSSRRHIGSERTSRRQNSASQGSFRSTSFSRRGSHQNILEGQEMEEIEQGRPLSRNMRASDETSGPSYALVIDGQSLALVLGEATIQGLFLQLCLQCASVLCCRVSPRQKAQVTVLVRKGLGESRLCLAIGDGANDVGMIQAANVGVGIAGLEGAQVRPGTGETLQTKIDAEGPKHVMYCCVACYRRPWLQTTRWGSSGSSSGCCSCMDIGAIVESLLWSAGANFPGR